MGVNEVSETFLRTGRLTARILDFQSKDRSSILRRAIHYFVHTHYYSKEGEI